MVFLHLASLGWPGEPNPCVAAGDCYCEAARAGLVAQPANTWSCMGGIAMGLAISWHTGRRHGEGSPRTRNRMGSTRFYPGLYALLVLYSGIGATFFHASLTNWGGKLDMASMYLSFGYWIFYNLARVYDLSRGAFLGLYVPATAATLVPRVFFDALGLPIFVAIVGAAVLCEILVARRLTVRRGWLWASLAVYVLALVVWRLSLAGQPLCDPHSLLQGHAFWHVLTALSPGMLYLYFLHGDAS